MTGLGEPGNPESRIPNPGGFLVVTNSSTGAVLGDRIREADDFRGCFLGLMFVPRLEEGEGLLLRGSPSIHMFFMRFPIDAVFLDRDGVVVKIASGLRPWTGFAGAMKARDVLELPAGRASGCAVGDRLEIRSSSNTV